jgi:hypothetical protein
MVLNLLQSLLQPARKARPNRSRPSFRPRIESLEDRAVPTSSITLRATDVAEGNSGFRAMNFTVSLSQPSDTPVTVAFRTALGGTAHARVRADDAQGDYIPIPLVPQRQVTIPRGGTQVTIPVFVIGDTRFEGNESIQGSISLVSGRAVLQGSTAFGRILNDDGNGPAMVRGLSLAPRSVPEGGAVTLRGRLVDPDRHDRLTLVIHWGDGSPAQTVRAGRDPFRVAHRFRQLPPGVASAEYVVRVTWFDQHGAGNSQELKVTVHNR